MQAGVLGAARPAVRVLHAGDDHDRDRPARRAGDPTDDEIRHGLEGNLCRCTGYENIVRAIRAAAAAVEVSEMAATETPTTGSIGQPVKRVEDPRLITGAAHYLDDLKLPGMAYVAILRSPYAHARISAHRHDARRRGARRRRRLHRPGLRAPATRCRAPGRPAASRTTSSRRGRSRSTRSTFTGAGVAAVVAETRSRPRTRSS